MPPDLSLKQVQMSSGILPDSIPMSESGSLFHQRSQAPSGPIIVLIPFGAGSGPAVILVWALSKFSACWVSVPCWPTRVRAVQSCQFSLPRARFIAGSFIWISGKAEGRSLQGGARQEVLVACLAQRLGIRFPSYGSKLFSGNSRMQRLQGVWGFCPWIGASPSVRRACVNKGPSQCMGEGIPNTPHPLALALQVCLWAVERSFSPALSTFRKCPSPPCQ